MKKFWRILKKVLIAAGVLSCAALFVIVLTSAIKHKNELVCKNIQVRIDYDSGLAFLSEGEIKSKLNYLSGGKLTGKTLSKVDFRTLEREIEKNPYVAHAQVFVNQSQDVVVDIIQKRPILRVVNSDGVSYYISEKNDRIPLSDKFTSHVTVALGNVDMHRNAKRDSAVQAALFQLVDYVRHDEVLNALVDQVYVHENGEFDLVPKMGGHIIAFGNSQQDMEAKFHRLKIFYKEGLNKVGWDKYKAINLKYDGQVVCEKRDTTNTI